MKKNKMMRAASALMVAVLLTTCTISGTFAKYVTSNEGSDSARVAKFGVTIQADGKLYGDKYTGGEITVSTPTENTANLSVDSIDDAKVVAPGTKSDEGLSFAVNGKPEVSTRLDVVITSQNIYLNEGTYAVMVEAPTVAETSFEANKYYTKDANNEYTLAAAYNDDATYYTMESEVTLDAIYYPVIYKSTDLTSGTIAADSLDAIAADYAKKLNENNAVTADLEDGIYTYTIENKVYAPNFDYQSLGAAAENITWEWAFEQEKDAEDTILGNLMAEGDATMKGDVVKVEDDKIASPVAADGTDLNDYCLNTSFSINITVTQVD